MQQHQPKVVAITGASSGIGRATAVRFARDGWRVGLIARGAEGLDQTRKDVIEAGGAASVQEADVADSAALEQAADRIAEELGPIDVWVNNAGVAVYGRFLDITEAEFRRLTETNYLGLVNGTRTALKRMIPRDSGAVVQVLSVLGYRGIPLMAPYCGSKFAGRGFTESVRSELIADGSRVHLTMVHPPAVNTPFYNHAASHMPKPVRPPPPIYQPEIIADAILLAATSRRREVKVTGSTWSMALANKVAPGLMDRLLGKVGVAQQQSDRGGAVAARDSNLFGPAQRLHAAHGPFDAESRGVSVQMWANRNRTAVALGLGLLALGVLARREMPPRRGRFGAW